MRFKKKIFPSKLYSFNIDVCFKHRNTSCTLLMLFIFKFENLGFLKQYDIYNFIFICTIKRKRMKPWFQFLHIHNEF